MIVTLTSAPDSAATLPQPNFVFILGDEVFRLDDDGAHPVEFTVNSGTITVHDRVLVAGI